MSGNYGVNSGKVFDDSNDIVNWAELLSQSSVLLKLSMCRYGGEIQSAGTYNGNYCCVKALEDSVVSATGNIDNFAATTILGGDKIEGIYSQVVITSGKCVLYNNGDS